MNLGAEPQPCPHKRLKAPRLGSGPLGVGIRHAVPVTDAERDLALLRRYEPAIRYTQGELFLPSPVEDYVGGASLHAVGRRGQARVLAGPGELTLERLAELGHDTTDARLYLTFVDHPLDRKAFKAWRRDPDRPRFVASSRFAAVGILSRLIDGFLRLTLVLRGKVPGGYAAAAALRMRTMPHAGTHPYYGHVTRDGGYVVLQYWYFYAMNDWRSTFGGVNDHEADWEQVTIFLVDRGDEPPVPAWVAFSSHDEVGDDLRRRWDDPDIEFVGEHPVVYAGAGSHSGAYLPGEYIVTVAAPIPRFIERFRRTVIRVLPWTDPEAPGIGIPYIDYRRGDGPGIGAGQEREWSPVLVTDDVPWVADYRGLWGLDTKDPLGGERAPAGPRYDRDGTVRESWGQPVAWAGLDKEAPTDAEARRELEAYRRTLVEQLAEIDAQLEAVRDDLRGRRARDRVTGVSPRHPSAAVRSAQAQVAELRERQDHAVDELEAVDRGLALGLSADEVHAHLHHRAEPLQDTGVTTGRRGRLLRLWSAGSASVLLAALGVILIVPSIPLLTPMLILVTVMLVIEATLRGKLLSMLGALLAIVVIGFVALAILGLFIGQFRLSLGILLAFVAIYMLWQTIWESIRTS